jgi:hypothetical protein
LRATRESEWSTSFTGPGTGKCAVVMGAGGVCGTALRTNGSRARADRGAPPERSACGGEVRARRHRVGQRRRVHRGPPSAGWLLVWMASSDRIFR